MRAAPEIERDPSEEYPDPLCPLLEACDINRQVEADFSTDRRAKMTEGRTVPGDMTLDQAVPTKSNYLSKEDCDPPILVQIAHMSWDTIEGDYGEEQKTVLHFHGDTKPFVLNQTNKELLKAATGATTVNEIKDKHIVLFNDPTIMFRGKVTGGIRIRAPKPGFQQPTTAARAPAPEPQMPDARDYDDGIPF